MLDNQDSYFQEARNNNRVSNWPRNACASVSTANTMNGVQENMDLSKTISYLAAANQQLAAAHNLALGHMQWLFTKYKKPIDYTDEGAAKCGKSKTSCSNCTLKEKKTDKNKKGMAIFKKVINHL